MKTRRLSPILFLALLLLPLCAFAQSPAPRTDTSLNSDWKFLRQDVPNASDPDFDDAPWQAVSLPHTWNNLDGQDGGNNYYRGPAWYRRHLTIDPALADKSLFLVFDGAATVTEVFVNGRPAGKHAGNFGTFCFDITSLVTPTNDNLIAVKVDNSHNLNVPPLAGDFTVFGGLYRPVHLLALDPLSVSPLDFASPGIYLKQTQVTPQQADVDITIKLRNANPAAKTASLTAILLDSAGKELQRASSSQAVPAAGIADAAQKLTIPNPRLWNGRKDAYMYQVAIEVRDGEQLTDRIVQPLGLRFYRVDPDQGFFLNGQSYSIHGVNRHQDRINKGWAISPADHEEDCKLILEMGCTGVRTCHYQHSQYFYSLCDQSGLIVWAELCCVNELTYSAEFNANARQQLTELIKQSYNHPSICFWSLYNELKYKNDATEAAAATKPWDVVPELNALAHELDPTRLTTAASNKPVENPMNLIPDVIAFNRYSGWYSGSIADWPKLLDQHHAYFPKRALAISEYGAGASIYQHEIDGKKPTPVSHWHPEEWQCTVHEAAWKAMHDRPWLWGTFLWNMFDFAADQRKEGDHLGRNDKGMMTYDRKIKKDVFFFYQANWTDAPMVHINSSRFTPRPLAHYPVKIYSNCDSVELKLNGHSLGALQAPDHIFLWKDVAFTPGLNTLEAAATRAGQTVHDSCSITYDPATPATKPSTTAP